MSTPTSVTQTITVKIQGKEFKLSKTEAKKLRDQLDDACADRPIFPPVVIPQPYPVPFYGEPFYPPMRPGEFWVSTGTAERLHLDDSTTTRLANQ